MRWCTRAVLTAVLAASAVAISPVAMADNKRLNSSVVANVYAAQRQAGCTG
ncbi:MAG TPA: CAP domain-containing protein, partial [Mycobacterium sp.]|nr:CAP domain-containing protein [Mycobacterium sp.]